LSGVVILKDMQKPGILQEPGVMQGPGYYGCEDVIIGFWALNCINIM